MAQERTQLNMRVQQSRTGKSSRRAPGGRRRIALVLNRKARGSAKADRFISALERRGHEVEVIEPETVAKGLAAIRKRRGGGQLIVVGGGDGTISGLLPALIKLNKPFGILPLGTANDFARSLGIPTAEGAAAEVISSGRARKVDIGFLGKRPFMNVAHLGLGANVAKAHKGLAKKLLGIAGYPLRVAEAYQKTRPIRVRIEADNSKAHEITCTELAVGPGKYFGSGLCLDRDATLNDGVLRLHAMAPRSAAGWAKLLPALASGRLAGAEGTLSLVAKKFVIEPRRKRVANVDGEIDGSFPATVTVRPGAVRVLVPRA
jgi:YegS/Rv2252/BmrU family lipid kinase